MGLAAPLGFDPSPHRFKGGHASHYTWGQQKWRRVRESNPAGKGCSFAPNRSDNTPLKIKSGRGPRNRTEWAFGFASFRD